MIEFPPEFYGLVEAMWTTYQPAIFVWMGLMFSAIVLFGFGIVAWSVIRNIT